MLKTSGKRKGYKVFGAIDYFTGRLCYQGQEGRINSDAYIAFLTSSELLGTLVHQMSNHTHYISRLTLSERWSIDKTISFRRERSER